MHHDPTPDQQSALYAALAKAQGMFAPIIKDRTATIEMKAGGKYTYRYADLAGILDAVRPALSSQGIALVQPITQGEDGSITVGAVLLHAEGGRIESWMGWSATGDIKALASTITYLRRYVVVALLGVAAEDDDDGSAAPAGRPVGKPAPKQPPAPKPAPPADAHHPTWERSRARFCARLGEMGLSYDDIAAFGEAHGKPRPSSMEPAGLKGLLDWLAGDEGRADVDEWLGKRGEVAGG